MQLDLTRDEAELLRAIHQGQARGHTVRVAAIIA